MRKILLSLVTVFAVVAMVAGATQAVWSSTASLPGNTVSTAKVELNIDYGQVVGETKPITIQNLLPGQQSGEEGAGVINTGTVPVKVKMYVTYQTNESGVCNYINLVNVRRFGYPLGYAVSESLFSSKSLADLKGPDNAIDVIAELPTNKQVRVYQTAELDINAPNTVQNKVCEWTEVFVGETL